MAYTAPPTEAVNNAWTAAKWNAYIRDNMAYLFNGRPKAALNREGSANYGTTSSSFVDVDATNLLLTATINGGIAEVIFSFTCTPPGATDSACFDVILDSTTRAGSTNGKLRFGPGGGERQGIVKARFTGLSVGSHTFKLQYKSTGSGSVTIHNNPHPIWGEVWEAG